MSARASDPHNLRNLAAKQPGAIIDTDRECHGCGYNLRGLRIGINCPECGMPSVVVTKSDDPLSIMPVRVILAFIRGCWTGCFSVLLMIGIVIARQVPDLDPMYATAACGGVSLLWVLSVMWLTPAFNIPQAVSRGFTHRSRLRRITRWSQWGWVLAAGMIGLEAAMKKPTTAALSMMHFGLVVGLIAGLTGMVLLSILLERLSDWTRDVDAERRFNLAMWSIPIATLLMLADFSHPLLRLAMLGLWVVSVCAFPWGLFSLSKSVTLSVIHNREHQDRTVRLEERKQRFYDHAGAVAANTNPAPNRSNATPPAKAAPAKPAPKPAPQRPVPRKPT